MTKLTIIMYHDIVNPDDIIYNKINIKHYKKFSAALTLQEFEFQLQYIIKNYNIIDPKFLTSVINQENTLQKNSILLTFDDGFLNHYKYVLPLFKKYNISGIFFPSVSTAKHDYIPSHYKFIYMMTTSNEKIVMDELFKIIDNQLRNELNLPPNDELYAKYSKTQFKNNVWKPEHIFVSRFLRYAIDQETSDNILDKLFDKFCENQKILSRKLFMTQKQIKKMLDNGMYIGGHGDKHFLLHILNLKKQEKEIKSAYDFLKNLHKNCANFNFYYCYPHGSYNQTSISILQKLNCKFAVTTKSGSNSTLQKYQLFREREFFLPIN